MRILGEQEMTKGDRDKLRAELAGKAMAAILGDYTIFQGFLVGGVEKYGKEISQGEVIGKESVAMADALMAELGIKGEE